MDAPQGFNPYLNLSEQEKGIELKNAALFNDVEKATFLIKAGANVNQIVGFSGSALESAIMNANREVAELLIEHGADVEHVSMNGDTLLMLAVEQKHINIVDLLLQKGAQVNKTNHDGITALTISTYGRHQGYNYYQATDVTFRLLCELNVDQLAEYAKQNQMHQNVVNQLNAILETYKNVVLNNYLFMPDCVEGDELSSERLKQICDLTQKDLQSNEEEAYKWFEAFKWYQYRIEHDVQKLYKEELNKNKVKVWQLMNLVSLENEYTLPPELSRVICDFLSEVQGNEGFSQLYLSRRINRDKEEALNFMISHQKPVTPLHDVNKNKRKAEDDLDEEGRNKRMRVESQEEQEQSKSVVSKYLPFGGDCSIQ